MTRNWWLTIQDRYPSALQDCITHFQMEYRDQWRTQIRRTDRLQQYFADVGNVIEIRMGYTPIGYAERGNRYGSIVKGGRLSFHRAFLFHTRERALTDALYFAFLVREEVLAAQRPKPVRRRESHDEPKRRDGPKVTLGERSKKLKKE